jgi:ABC-2 type transport system ATP-binding protein
MDEAQFLADRVAVIRDGRIVAEGAPNELGGRADRATTIRFRLPAGVSAAELPAGAGTPEPAANGSVALSAADPVAALNALTGWALERGVDLAGLEVTRPSLEDMYLELTADGDRETA